MERPPASIGRLLRPEDIAAAVVRATIRRRRLLVLSPVAHAAWWLSRVAPRAYDRLMRRSQRDEFPARG